MRNANYKYIKNHFCLLDCPKFNNTLYGEGLREKMCSFTAHESCKLVQLLWRKTWQYKNYKCT